MSLVNNTDCVESMPQLKHLTSGLFHVKPVQQDPPVILQTFKILSITIRLFEWHVYDAEMGSCVGVMFKPLSETFSALWDKISKAVLEFGSPAVTFLRGGESFLTAKCVLCFIYLIRRQRHRIFTPEENANDIILSKHVISILLYLVSLSPTLKAEMMELKRLIYRYQIVLMFSFSYSSFAQPVMMFRVNNSSEGRFGVRPS